MKVRNYIARSDLMGKGGKFVTDTQTHKNRKDRRLSKQKLKTSNLSDLRSFYGLLKGK